MKTKTIWTRLLQFEQQIITRKQIKEICDDLNLDYTKVVHNLQVSGRVVRIFRGIFYVMSPDEMAYGYHKKNLYWMIAEGLRAKGVSNWYFGLETALSLNNMTHEYFVVNYVITDTYRTTKTIKIMEGDFKFLRWSKKRFQEGINEDGAINYSDKEKTVLDLIYRSCNRRKPVFHNEHNKARGILKEYWTMLDEKKIESYLRSYPVWMGDMVWRNLVQSSLKH